MSDNVAVSGVLNGLLCGATGFCFFKISPQEHPYAFTAAVIGFCHGLLGLISVAAGENEGTVSAKKTTTAIMEIIPLPLVNVELYLMGESNNIALGHGLFIVPLAVDLLFSLFKDAEAEGSESTETLKHLTILGNVTSLLYLAVNESSWLYGGMALVAFLTKYSSMFVESHSEGSGAPLTLLGHSCFFFLTATAVSGEK